MKMWTVAAVAVTAGFAAYPLHADELDKSAGKALFERNWIAAPSSTDGSDGLGPLFNECVELVIHLLKQLGADRSTAFH